ncbi:NADPH:quinone oxidoreductase family protein [Aeromicrobium duanguangcaii]|uniref:NADPH:quinone oxidoreductase family protein n=1 Tax=Aeromicrobium duanguangcaii TaxID=2968086 RepID=A0ABY5KH73_9ACTN|nr:NADPH:quinone oxidoreductase family protein [Aeromicrobium duanguangcaii]MCD9154553.1 NADPH:quinone oxidoreductase family protein [Aeromicrobium duanguangcaii]MCL3838303.1 NADPH:quinone oxidoreductase family protein [Aeromicrobium duanguangcaii]UUI68391.1 NADPH:quinone oxidoreductase family protein [Aeromicrobium duanguangcaii]
MRAIQITSLDGPEAVELVEIQAPERGEDQVLIDVKAAGVAFPELLQSRGMYQLKPPLPFVPGAEIAGVVVEAPVDSGFAPGDRVAALPMLGGFAEQVIADVDLTFPLPDDVTFAEGASFIFNYGTAYFGLVNRGALAPGERVLVHGASGGIGTASIQVAKAFGAGRVIAVTSTDEKGEIAIAAGADEYVLSAGFKDAVKATGGVDIVVDPVGNAPEGDRFTDSLRCLNDDGRILIIGFTAGEIPKIAANRLLLNNLSAVGVGWGAYAMKRPGLIKQQWEAMAEHLASGALRPVVGQTFPLDRATEALLTLDRAQATGKLVLEV